jgi:alpha-D-xyloside xylohydrolase
VGDLSYAFQGIGRGIERVLSLQYDVAAPYNELTGYGFLDDGTPDEETYIRRLHFGCFQPVMAHTPYANADPWLPQYSPQLLDVYRYYAWLHKELVPYFYSYAYGMFEDPGDPAVRVLRSGPSSSSFGVGDELFVTVVTSSTDTLRVTLPPESPWIDYWDESVVLSGTVASHPVPLGREPIFIKEPAIIPMDVERDYTGHGTSESRGALTVLVYPRGETSFRHRDEKSNSWITITAAQDGGTLTLDMTPAMPSVPVIYRIGRWSQAPTSISTAGNTVSVNLGGDLAESASEKEVNGASRDSWYYDASARRLIVKVMPE